MIDLHCHTKWTKKDSKKRQVDKEKFYQKTKKWKLELIAITNHDEFDAKQFTEFKEKLKLEKSLLKLLPGIELTTKINNKEKDLIIISSDKKMEEFTKNITKLLIKGKKSESNAKKFFIEYVVIIDFLKSLDFKIILSIDEKSDKRWSKEEIYVLQEKIKPNSENICLISDININGKLNKLFITFQNKRKPLFGTDNLDWDDDYDKKANLLLERTNSKFKINTFERLFLFLSGTYEKIRQLYTDLQYAEMKFNNLQLYNEDGVNLNEEIKNLKYFRGINILIGKRGSGKSCLLKSVERKINDQNESIKFLNSNQRDRHFDEAIIKQEINNKKKYINDEINNINNFSFVAKNSEIINLDYFNLIEKYLSQDVDNKFFNDFSDLDSISQVQKNTYINDFNILINLFNEINKLQIFNTEMREANISYMNFLLNSYLPLLYEKNIEKNVVNMEKNFIYNVQNILKINKGIQSKPTSKFKEWGKEKVDIFKKNIKLGEAIKYLKENQSISKEIRNLSFHFKYNLKLEFKKPILINTFINELFNFDWLDSNLEKFYNHKDIKMWSDLYKFHEEYYINNIKKENLSKGQKAEIGLISFLESDVNYFIMDDADGGLDSKFINSKLNKKLNEMEENGKFIFIATHNANLAINSLPINTIYKDFDKNILMQGNMFSNEIREINNDETFEDWDKTSIKILEGGEEALKKRLSTYNKFIGDDYE